MRWRRSQESRLGLPTLIRWTTLGSIELTTDAVIPRSLLVEVGGQRFAWELTQVGAGNAVKAQGHLRGRGNAWLRRF